MPAGPGDTVAPVGQLLSDTDNGGRPLAAGLVGGPWSTSGSMDERHTPDLYLGASASLSNRASGSAVARHRRPDPT